MAHGLNTVHSDYIDFSYNFCYGLYELGFRQGDKIITVSSNRPEWNFADMGMAMLGVVHVPVFTSLNASEYEYIIKNSGAKVVLVSDNKLFCCLSPALKNSDPGVMVYTFDSVPNTNSWTEVINKGKSCSGETVKEIEKIKASITADTFATLIYTSGTTGNSKGVMLSHRNLVSNFISAASVFNLNEQNKYLSILPLCHVGGRMGNYQTQYSGSSIYYAESMGTIAVNMQEIKPDGFDAVPRVLEKFYDVIISKGKKLSGIKKALFFWAVELGLRYKPYRRKMAGCMSRS
ncbi:MAG: AMP-binding protein [Marinilabiliales bacterium]|nr:AMP-binding protein [Marinilabiliales bacterium]